MNSSSAPDLVKITEAFLIPSSFLVAALGTADTNLHRAGVSLVGLVIRHPVVDLQFRGGW